MEATRVATIQADNAFTILRVRLLLSQGVLQVQGGQF